MANPTSAPVPAPVQVAGSWPLPAHSSVARLQQVRSVLTWAAALGLLVAGLVWPHAWSPAWALLPLCLMPLVLGLQTVLAHGVNRAGGLAITPAGSWRAWRSEVVAAAAVFGWRQPWAWRALPDALPPAGATPQRGVLLVHGYMCNRGLWNRWLDWLPQRGHAVVALNLEPMLGDIDEYTPAIDAAVTRLTQATGMPPLVVCHSMGGLAVRAWMGTAAGADDRVHHVVTIGSPHHGTWLARWGLGANAGQMRCQNPWLTALAQAEPPGRCQKFTCWHSNGDNIVFPLGTAVLPGAAAHCLPGVGHVALVDHPAIQAHVLKLLQGNG